MEIRHGNHCVYGLNYYFVWCPKYRHSFLNSVEETLTEALYESIDGTAMGILSMHVSPDHVHLFVSGTPTMSPSDMVRRIKSISARRLWSECKETMEKLYWGGGCWERSYYVGTAGVAAGETIQRYIERTNHL
jgi:putative transposase